MDGILNVNKPAGMTSHDVVKRLRRLLNEGKIGHTGTLDPDATGVLPLCLGKATKIIQFLRDDEKGYEGTITLGVVTDTLDSSGKVLNVSDSSGIGLDDVKKAFDSFVGEIYQTPPMVSAIKVQGERLYNIARRGETISRTPRRVHIYALELLDLYKARCPIIRDQETGIREQGKNLIPDPLLFTMVDFRVRCSKGTYVRSLAADIGDALGCGAHLSSLIRTKSGIFELKDAISLEEIQADPQNALRMLRSIDDVLSFMPKIVIADSTRERFLNGVPVKGSEIVSYEGEFHAPGLTGGDLIRVHDEAGALLGIGRATQGTGNRVQGSGQFPISYSLFPDPLSLIPRDVICKAIRVLK